jgi:adenylate cyclase
MTGAPCTMCGATAMRDNAKFCDECGSPVTQTHRVAEYKQVTVLFADVVGSMDIAAAVGAERLREIMAGLVGCASAVVRRYGGTVDKFTGDGVMALFGAPIALEDHALRACRAALEIHSAIGDLAEEVRNRDGVELALRVGLNSGQVIAGEIGSGAAGYTAVGEQVGLAQRMESVAPAGGVMLSESTARLVEHVLSLGEPQWVRVKGAQDPLAARRLLALVTEGARVGRGEPTLVGRDWELATVSGVLERAVSGRGSVVAVVGSPGIGKSRLVREAAGLATGRGVEVFSTYCESHTSQVPFHVVARLLRTIFGVSDLDARSARAQVRARIPSANPEDLILFDDLLGIGDPAAVLPDITAEARQQRLARLVSAASLARATPAVYVIEDVHWIDEVSEAMIAGFTAVIPQSRAMVLLTYRPEYRGALSRTPNAHTLAVAPLDPTAAATLTTELVGTDPSVRALAARIAERADGNPFFAQEIVRDLAERGVLRGQPQAYTSTVEAAEVRVPATVQATIAARIDRLDSPAKQTLSAASVIGSRFRPDLLTEVLAEVSATDEVAATLGRLVEAELLDQVAFTPHAEYAFHHPLIRAVAYESQLTADRAVLHRRLAAAIEARDPGSADENAALIAEHLQAAGDLHGAYGWHMRAAGWSTYRDIGAARTNWQRARRIADQLPVDDPNRLAMQIAPRTLLCGSAWRIGGTVEDAGFEQLRSLCATAGDRVSLAIGMAGLLQALSFNDRIAESARLATECAALVESIGDPVLTVGLLPSSVQAKCQAGEVVETLRLAQHVIDLAEGDATMGNLVVGSPLSFAQMYRGYAEMSLGKPGFREHFQAAIATARPVDPTCFAAVVMFRYCCIGLGVSLPDDIALRDTADALAIAEQSGDPFAVACALLARGVTLVHRDGPESEAGYDLLAKVRAMALAHQFSLVGVPVVDIHNARRMARTNDVGGAIALCRAAVHGLFVSGDMLWRGLGTSTLVEFLLRRGADGDIAEAQAAIDTLAAVPTDPGFVFHELPLLRMRALLARAQGDEVTYQEYADRYRKMATDVGFEGHMKWAEAMR